MFQHTAARRRLHEFFEFFDVIKWFQHTAARRRLQPASQSRAIYLRVSTHSRPKAAAEPVEPVAEGATSFNTQPPEGGCICNTRVPSSLKCFNTQPPEGGCLPKAHQYMLNYMFQHTAARRRLRGDWMQQVRVFEFQHTAARRRLPLCR